MATYLTPAAPAESTGFLMKAETAVKVGTGRLWASLEHTSWVYSTYGASIGLQAGQSEQLGILAELTFTHTPSFEPLEAFNMTDDPLYEVTGEETTVSVEIREFKPTTIRNAIGTGSMYELGNERVITFGGGCSMVRRPYCLEFDNEACLAPTSENITNGVSGGAVTLYDAFVSSGLEWALNAKEGNTVGLELQALPVTTLSRGNRLGNIYLF